jgi:hypothetical protein
LSLKRKQLIQQQQQQKQEQKDQQGSTASTTASDDTATAAATTTTTKATAAAAIAIAAITPVNPTPSALNRLEDDDDDVDDGGSEDDRNTTGVPANSEGKDGDIEEEEEAAVNKLKLKLIKAGDLVVVAGRYGPGQFKNGGDARVLNCHENGEKSFDKEKNRKKTKKHLRVCVTDRGASVDKHLRFEKSFVCFLLLGSFSF